MNDWIDRANKILSSHAYSGDNVHDMLDHILKGQLLMALDLSKLEAANLRLATALQTVLNELASVGPSVQGQIDNVTTSLNALAASAETAAAPPAPVAPAPPGGPVPVAPAA